MNFLVSYIENLNYLDSTTLTLLGVAMMIIPIGFLIYLKLTTNPDLIKKILELKYKRKSFLGLVMKSLGEIGIELQKLILDLKTLEMYNTEHAKKLLEKIRYAEIGAQFINILENSEISENILNFLNKSKQIAINIYQIEDTLYRKQFEYNTNVISNSNLVRNEEGYHLSEEYIDEINDFKTILFHKKDELTSLINETQKIRKDLNTSLIELEQVNNELINRLHEYEKSKLDSKKFYFRYLSYF